MALVTVCIPTYNGADYIVEAITSVLNQTFTDFELIIVDDASTDNTIDLVQSFDDTRLKVYRNTSRLGLVRNWNECLSFARSQYVCIFHQDDVMLSKNLERKVRALEDHPQVGMVYSNVQIIDAAGQVTARNWLYPTEATAERVIPQREFFEALILDPNNPICCPSVVARRASYETAGEFDPRLPFTADWEMWARMSLFYDVLYLPEQLLNYRLHRKNESQHFRGAKGLEEIYRAKRLVLDKYPEKLPNPFGLKQLMQQKFQQQAVKQAIHHYLQQQEEDGQQCLSLALTIENKANLSVKDFRDLALDICLQLGQQLRDQRSWNDELEKGKAWLDEQRQNWQRLAEGREVRITELTQGKTWLEEEWQKWLGFAEERETQITVLKEDKAQLEEKRQKWQGIAEERGAQMTQLTQGKTWLEEEWQKWQGIAAERETQITALKEGKARLEEERQKWQGIAAERETQITALKQGKAQLEEEQQKWQGLAAERETQITALKEGQAQLEEEWQKWQGLAAERETQITALKEGQAQLEEEQQKWQGIATERETQITALKQGKAQLEEEWQKWQGLAAEREAQITELKQGKAQLEEERQEWQGIAEERETQITALKEGQAQLEEEWQKWQGLAAEREAQFHQANLTLEAIRQTRVWKLAQKYWVLKERLLKIRDNIYRKREDKQHAK